MKRNEDIEIMLREMGAEYRQSDAFRSNQQVLDRKIRRAVQSAKHAEGKASWKDTWFALPQNAALLASLAVLVLCLTISRDHPGRRNGGAGRNPEIAGRAHSGDGNQASINSQIDELAWAGSLDLEWVAGADLWEESEQTEEIFSLEEEEEGDIDPMIVFEIPEEDFIESNGALLI